MDLGWITQVKADQYIAAMSQHMVNGASYGCGKGGGMMNGGIARLNPRNKALHYCFSRFEWNPN